VRDFAGDVVGNAADREVRVSVGDHYGDFRARVQFAGAQRGADPRIAATDHHKALHDRLSCGLV